MNKEEALEICFDLWMWLAVTGGNEDEKEDWPEWEDNGGDIEFCINDCPCCEYVNSGFGYASSFADEYGTGLDCGKCPIDWGVRSCCSEDSIYRKWIHCDESKRPEYALEIAKRALDALFELKGI